MTFTTREESEKLTPRQMYYLGWNLYVPNTLPTKEQIKEARQKKMMEEEE